jgi:hypothetical protein
MTEPCRRRPIFAARGTGVPAATAVAALLEAHPEVSKAPQKPTKGACPKCGRHIGRGVNFHAKKCRTTGDEEKR